MTTLSKLKQAVFSWILLLDKPCLRTDLSVYLGYSVNPKFSLSSSVYFMCEIINGNISLVKWFEKLGAWNSW